MDEAGSSVIYIRVVHEGELRLKKFLAILISVEFVLGIALSFGIAAWNDTQHGDWNQALKVDSKESLEAALNEDSDIYCYGEITAVNPVTNEDLDGKYSYIKQEYQSKGDNWVTKETKSWHCDSFMFYDKEYAYKDIPFPSMQTTDVNLEKEYFTEYRYHYSTVPETFKGVMHFKADGSIRFYPSYTLETIAPMSKATGLVIFWLVYIVTAGIIDWFWTMYRWDCSYFD